MRTEPHEDLPPLVLRQTALRQGFVDDEIARMRRRGDWVPLQRGAYLAGDRPLSRRARHLLVVHATLAGLRTPAVVSHASAAALHGLPLWGVPLTQVHITRRPPARTDSGTRLRSHAARLADEDVVAVGTVPVTAVARTVVDLARTLPFAPALAVADAALHAGTTTPDDLRRVLEATAGSRGSRSARRVVEAADGRSESVGESRSRAVMIQLGLPLPDLQVEVRRPDGLLVGRCDFGWREARLLGEFDGRVKYGRLLRPGQSPGDAVFEEKRREDALRDEGFGMVRWVWSELDTPGLLGRRVMARLR
ncbi:hypothetical protein ACI797_03725 [Geodermatophilus sp. SYSU D00691]